MERPVRILYVEDEPFLGKIVKESLQSRAFEVEMVEDGNLVMTTYHKFQPDICVLDVMLPGRDGFSIGKEIHQKDPGMPIIYLTARDQTEDLLTGFKSGGNDYIRKPFSMEELIVRIDNLLRLSGKLEQSLPVPKVIRFSTIEYAPRKLELRVADQPRQLTHRENELLKLLASSPNQTIKRKDILLRLWGDDSIFNSRNLDVYITKLRQYLEPDPNVQIITLKGIGYHFRVDEG